MNYYFKKEDSTIVDNYIKHRIIHDELIKKGIKIDNREYINYFEKDMLELFEIYKKYSGSERDILHMYAIEAMELYTDLFNYELVDENGFSIQYSDETEAELFSIIDFIENNLKEILSFVDNVLDDKKVDSNSKESAKVNVSRLIYNYAMYNILIDEKAKAIEILELNIEKYNSLDSRVELIVIYSANPLFLNLNKAISLLPGLIEEKIESTPWGENNYNKITCAYSFVINSLIKNCEYNKCLDIIANYRDNYSKFNYYDKTIFIDSEKNCHNKLDVINNPSINDDILKQVGFNEKILNSIDKDVSVYIQTSLVLYDSIKDKKEMTYDFSPVNITFCKAIELILYKIIDKYLSYLKKNESKYNYDTKVLRKSVNIFLYKNHDIKEGLIDYFDNNFEMGIALFSIAIPDKDSKPIVRKSFEDFCNDNLCKCEGKVFDDLLVRLFQIYDKRNACAHRNRVVLSDAEECKNLLFKGLNVIKLLYKFFKTILI